jgi:hypothetical protein
MQKGPATHIHLVNLSGHSVTAYHAPLEMRNIQITLPGRYKSARAIRNPAALSLKHTSTHAALTLPRLGDYELIVLE